MENGQNPQGASQQQATRPPAAPKTKITDFFSQISPLGTPATRGGSPRSPQNNPLAPLSRFAKSSDFPPSPYPSSSSSANSVSGRERNSRVSRGMNSTTKSSRPARVPYASDGRPARLAHDSPVRMSNLTVARNNATLLPRLAAQRPDINPKLFTQYDRSSKLPPLDPARCPGYSAAKVVVINEDTINAALKLQGIVGQEAAALQMSNASTAKPAPLPGPRVAAMNFANARTPGGGYIRGAMAQEEALCYRSSLYMSLKGATYPWNIDHVLYTPDVLVHRRDTRAHHQLFTDVDPRITTADLPVISIISVAAETRVRLAFGSAESRSAGHLVKRPEIFAQKRERDHYKLKLRMSLRALATHGHSAVVMGALGCGVFRNPVHDAALCWREVLTEPEFKGWFSHVWFAVMGPLTSDDKFAIFSLYLGGVEI
ncbi:hypothetical protein HOO65_030131 [Ceratocystis lukuohia]|uniref:Microbial-type PARG catalytic domain-containing protein n=1 Tax=Ceratocystis lukuohia TaxID=2019550 RepID=A0ABR4MK33_9PEZI